MSESSAFDFTKFVPGFDFLKKLSESQATFPQAQQWIAPTVDPQEIEKRIQELKTVHFWLEQNTRAVLATVQALEVQLMTINTLKGMNMSMSEMAKGLEIKPQNASQRGDASEQSSASKKKDYFAQNASVDPFKSSTGPANHESATDTDRDTDTDTDADLSADALKPDASANSAQDSVSKGQASQAVDPMAWWGALSQQFSQIANQTFSEIQKNSAAVAAAQSKAVAPQSKEKKADSKTEKATKKTKVKPQTKPKTQPKSPAISKAKAKPQANSKVKASEKAPLKTAVKSPTKVATSKAAVKKTATVKSAQAKKSTDTSDPVVALKSWFSSPPALTRKGAPSKKGT